jgi:serine protease
MNRTHLLRLVLVLTIILAALAVVRPGFTAGSSAPVRVWVEFSPGQKANLEQALQAAGAEMHFTFENLNAFVVSLPEKALAGIQRNPNVVSIEEDARRELFGQDVPFGIDMVQARDVWDAKRDGAVDDGAPTGAGRLVCIIDSGLFTGHQDFSGVNVVGGYPTGWNTDTCGHGTHVAGTIAAANNGVGVVGVTPGTTSLYIVKVFGDNCAWTYSSSLVDAANRCASAGANIISMSLGGGKSPLEERAFNSLYNQGILSIAAAGNDGTTATSYPAGYSSVVSVAAIDKNMVVADFSQKNSTVELAAPGVGVVSTIPYIADAKVAVDGVNYSGIHVEYAKYGSASGVLVDGGLCTTTGDWSGKVVLCQRGTISFFDKVKNVQNSGGRAVLIYNNEAGDLHATLGDGNTSSIPALGLTQTAGQFLVGNKLGQTATVTDTIQWEESGYEAWDGTSMATPHVSGVAALIWSSNPSLTNVQIRDAMVKTAKDLGAAGKDNSYGYGLVQAYAAWQYIGGGGGGGGGTTIPLTVTLGTDKTSYKFNQVVTITVTVKDDKGAAVSGATAAVTIKTAGGKTYTGSTATDASGTAVFKYTPKVSDGAGTYNVTVQASKEGYVSATGSTTFTVSK